MRVGAWCGINESARAFGFVILKLTHIKHGLVLSNKHTYDVMEKSTKNAKELNCTHKY